MSDAHSIHVGRAKGAMFLAIFGAAWLFWWCLESYGTAPGKLALIAAGGTGILYFSVLQFRRHKNALTAQATTLASKKRSRLFTFVNIVQWILIVGVANLLGNLGRSEWIVPAIIFIVGLHFIPLAAIFHYQAHYLTGFTLLALAVVYPFVSADGPASSNGLLGAGTILWVSAIYMLTAEFRTKSTGSS